jgi:hypothetical protein
VPNKLYQAIFLAPLSGIEEEEAPTPTTSQQFFWLRCRGERGFLQGESLTSNLLLCYCFAYFLYFVFVCIVFIENTKKLVPISSFFYV